VTLKFTLRTLVGDTSSGDTTFATLHATGIRVEVPLLDAHVIDPNAYWGITGADGAKSVIFRVWR
jgi:hypothetical protein